MPGILIIAGSDSSGGAGLLRDAAVVRDFGLRPRCVVTAVTAQTDTAVLHSLPMPVDAVSAQMKAVLSDEMPDAVKIGMLATAEIAAAVAAALRGRDVPVVLDPVLQASSGRALLTDAGTPALIQKLLPLCTLVTPNLSEAAALTGIAGTGTAEQAAAQAGRLRSLGASAVLIKGGHGTGDRATDRYFDGQGAMPLTAPRLPVARRGTGCTLSSAIACGLAAGHDPRQACRDAKAYMQAWLSGDAGAKIATGKMFP